MTFIPKHFTKGIKTNHFNIEGQTKLNKQKKNRKPHWVADRERKGSWDLKTTEVLVPQSLVLKAPPGPGPRSTDTKGKCMQSWVQ